MNRYKTYYCDWRLTDVCAYCGDFADSEDHVPSKCFLDSPLPPDPPVVPCCHHCNEQFSYDEEYVSCIIDCMKEGTIDVQSIKRDKTRATLTHSKGLAERIRSQYVKFGEDILWNYEKQRFKSVFRKLAFGHLAYQNETLAMDSNYQVSMMLLDKMNKEERCIFELPYSSVVLPEIGSRTLQQEIILYDDSSTKLFTKWNIVQDGRYRYCTSSEGNKVKFVIAEYLAVEVEIKTQ